MASCVKLAACSFCFIAFDYRYTTGKRQPQLVRFIGRQVWNAYDYMFCTLRPETWMLLRWPVVSRRLIVDLLVRLFLVHGSRVEGLRMYGINDDTTSVS